MDKTGASSSSSSSSLCLWARLSDDLTSLILSHLPLSSLVRSSAVCSHWRRIISDPSFAKTWTRNVPWFFLYGQNNIFLKQNQAFGFDPESDCWIRLPTSSTCFSGAAGFIFSTTPSPTRILYSSVLSTTGPHQQTSPLSFSRLNPLVGVFSNNNIIFVGGARFIGGLVDIEDPLAVEIYYPNLDSWELCAALPPQFSSNHSSSQWLCSALLFDRLFFVLGIFSNTLSAFDLVEKVWSPVRILRPPGVVLSFLIACRDRLILAGVCNASFTLWDVDYESLECREIGAMPKDLMACLFDSEDDDDAKFASLKCVGLDGVVYVFNEDRREGYPACVCEVGEDLDCKWRKVPPLPGPVNRFHKVITFCSDVPLQSVLARCS